MIRQLIGVTGQYASVDELLTSTENLYLFGRLQGRRRAESGAAAARLLTGSPFQRTPSSRARDGVTSPG